jgi:predicted transcriptional regulator of viral defense system
MKSMDALRELGDLTASQWGMVTTAQATARGISRLQLSRLADDGQLERVGHGIYRDMGAPAERFDGLKVAWLSLNPKLTVHERMQAKPADAVVSGPTASHLLDLGDLVPEPYQFTVPARRQTQRDSLVFRVRKLPASSVTIREGLPVTTTEQTIADLIDERQDMSLVADVFAEADSLDSAELTRLLAPLAQRNGFKRRDGTAFYLELERLARRDVESLARAVSSTPLAASIVRDYLRSIDLAPVTESSNAQIAEAIGPALEAINRQVAEALAVPIQMDARTRRQLVDMAAKMRPPLATTELPTLTTR